MPLFTLSEAGVKKTIQDEVTIGVVEDSIFYQFMGTGANAPIKTQEEIDNTNGLCDIRLRGNLRGDGIEGEEDFETNEDTLKNLYMQVILETFGNSVKSGKRTKLLNQTQFIDFRDDAKESLQEWGTDRLDRMIISRAVADATCIIVEGNPTDTTTSNATATDYTTVAGIRRVIAAAKSSVHTDGSAKPKVKPFRTVMTTDEHGVKVKRKIFLMFLGEASAYNLKQDPEWREAQKDANDRGMGNPIFTGQLGVIDDTVCIEIGTVSTDYAGIYTSADTGVDGQDFSVYAGASSAKMEINFLMGATAMVMPMDSGFQWHEDTYDMKRKAKVGIDRNLVIQKAKFVGKTAEDQASSYHNKDFSIIVYVASATKIPA